MVVTATRVPLRRPANCGRARLGLLRSGTCADDSGDYDGRVATGPGSTTVESTDAVFLSSQIACAAIVAVTVGLLDAALVSSGLLGARGAFQYVPARIWIASPAVWTAVAAAIAVAFLPLRRRSAGLLAAALPVGIFVAIRLRAHPALLAIALVAAGALLALVRRVVYRWMSRARPVAASVIPGIVAAAALVAAVVPFSTTAGAASGGRGPNVIVVFLDTVRYDALFDEQGRAHDDVATMAQLQRESIVFTRAYAASPWTLPSHLSALTGLPPHQLGVSFDSQVYHRSDLTLAERFHRRGYRTAAVISNSFLNAGTGVARGFDTFEQAESALDICRTAPGVMADAWWPWFSAAVCNWTASGVTKRALSLMHDERGPFFLMLNYMDAHDPYYVERSCGGDDGYRAAVRCLDRQLAPIVNWRSTRPTVLAIVGDHGEQFGEHGLRRHGNSVYVQLLHVPLIIRPATGAHAQLRTVPLSIAALPALIDDATVDPAADGPVLALLHPPAASNLPSEWSALDGAWHLIVREHGSDALYYLPADPEETRNRIGEDGANPAIARLRASIEQMRRTPKPDLRRFRSLGYLQ